MKKLGLMLVGIFMIGAASATSDKIIEVNQLPAKAQEFIKAKFVDKTVSHAKLDDEWVDKTYEAIFTDGSKVEFDKLGNWTEVACKTSEIPSGLVAPAILKQLKVKYDGRKILKIERSKRGTELKLDNGLELKFDKNHKLVEMDD